MSEAHGVLGLFSDYLGRDCKIRKLYGVFIDHDIGSRRFDIIIDNSVSPTETEEQHMVCKFSLSAAVEWADQYLSVNWIDECFQD
jgi:hypothetical protein